MTQPWSLPHKQILIPAVLAAAALCLRAFYAWGLPLNFDEMGHLRVISGFFTQQSGSGGFPLGSRLTSHPLFADYLLSMGLALGMGRFFAARLFFIAVSLLGLAGIFALAKELFGTRAGLFALAIASVDRFMVAWAPLTVEQAGYAFVPWMLLFFFRAVEKEKPRDFLFLGAAGGIGYMFYEPAVMVLLPMALYALFFGHGRKILASPLTWAGLAVFLIIISPHLYYNGSQGWVNFKRHETLASGIGLSPRLLLLYLGDLLMTFPDPYRVALEGGNAYFFPFRTTCALAPGVLYLAAVLFSLKFVKDRRFALLLIVFSTTGLITTLINAREPWNNFWWATPCLIVSIVLSGSLSDKWARILSARGPAAAVGIIVLIPTLIFLGGEKQGYHCFNQEIRFVGRMSALRMQMPALEKISRASLERMHAEAASFVQAHPKSSIGVYFLAESLAGQPDKVKQVLDRAQKLDPNNPLALNSIADQAMARKDWETALSALERAVQAGYDCYVFRKKAAMCAYGSGRSAEAESHALRAMGFKADARDILVLMFLIAKDLGRDEKAESYLEAYIASSFDEKWKGYMEAARLLEQEGKHELAGEYLKKAKTEAESATRRR